MSNQNPAPQTANVQQNLVATVGQNMPPDHFGGYPTDPTNGIADIIKYLQDQADYRYLIHGFYDLVGFVLKMVFGDPADSPVDPAIMQHAVDDLKSAITANPQRVGAIPIWLLPLLNQGIQLLMLWFQNHKQPQQQMITAGPDQGIPPWVGSLVSALLQLLMNRRNQAQAATQAP